MRIGNTDKMLWEDSPRQRKRMEKQMSTQHTWEKGEQAQVIKGHRLLTCWRSESSYSHQRSKFKDSPSGAAGQETKKQTSAASYWSSLSEFHKRPSPNWTGGKKKKQKAKTKHTLLLLEGFTNPVPATNSLKLSECSKEECSLSMRSWVQFPVPPKHTDNKVVWLGCCTPIISALGR